jgi:hypothetical protein
VRKLNDLAYEEMILCIDGTPKPGKVAFGCFDRASTIDIQLGSAREAWKRLNNKFEPKTAPSRLRLQNLFHESYLQSSQDPDKWITELEELRMRIIAAKSELTEESLMEHVLNNVPEMYSIEVSKLEDRLGDLSGPLTIKEICGALSLKYQRVYSKKNKNKRFNQNEETALFAGGFKGKCNNCGQFGHKLRDCRNKKNINNNNNNQNHKNNKGNGEAFPVQVPLLQERRTYGKGLLQENVR